MGKSRFIFIYFCKRICGRTLLSSKLPGLVSGNFYTMVSDYQIGLKVQEPLTQFESRLRHLIESEDLLRSPDNRIQGIYIVKSIDVLSFL